jgi:hypothetical protein
MTIISADYSIFQRKFIFLFNIFNIVKICVLLIKNCYFSGKLKFKIKDNRISTKTGFAMPKLKVFRKKKLGAFSKQICSTRISIYRISPGVSFGYEYFMQNLVIICCSSFSNKKFIMHLLGFNFSVCVDSRIF